MTADRHHQDRDRGGPSETLSGPVLRAHLALFAERLWPALLPVLALITLFLALSWFGIWTRLPDLVRVALLGLFGVAALAALWPMKNLRFPSRRAALARIETASGLTGQPLLTLEDRLANEAGDPATRALWRAHRRRLVRTIGRLSAGLPRPQVAALDPYALRAPLILALVVAFTFAGGERLEHIAAAFRGFAPTATEAAARIDAWVNPPLYTARPPIFLTAEGTEAAPIAVPEGSIVVIRLPADAGLVVTATVAGTATALTPDNAPAAGDADIPAAGPIELRTTLTSSSRVAIGTGGAVLHAWDFAVEPDQVPEIQPLEQPKAAVSGALDLSYSLRDDYGIVGAEARFDRPSETAADSAARPLYDPPGFALLLPQPRVRDGRGKTLRNLTDHPWSGSPAIMTLVARDEAGKEGISDRVRMVLPERSFTKPLARAIVEQRRKLALDANRAGYVADALDALTLAPERFMPDTKTYLALRVARHRLINSGGDDDLRAVVELLWQIALGIEDGDLSLAERALRDAQDRLAEALERGASDEEIARLTEELRNALDNFMRELAERMRDNPDTQPLDPDAQTLSQDELQKMLDRMEELAKSGARDAARQLLAEMQRMLENLATGQMQPMDPQSGEMAKSLEELGDMIRRQSELMDETFRRDSEQNGAMDGNDPQSRPDDGGKPGAKPKSGREAARDLRDRQQSLEQALGDLADRLKQSGAGENEALDRAGEAMGRATRDLGRGRLPGAVDNQGEALQSLREGAEQLAEQLAKRQANRVGMGNRRRNGEDPLGRPERSRGPQFGDNVKVPDEIDAARARRILEEIRRRLGDAGLERLDRDYLERLLRRY